LRHYRKRWLRLLDQSSLTKQAYEAKIRINYIGFDCAASSGWRTRPGQSGGPRIGG